MPETEPSQPLVSDASEEALPDGGDVPVPASLNAVLANPDEVALRQSGSQSDEIVSAYERQSEAEEEIADDVIPAPPMQEVPKHTSPKKRKAEKTSSARGRYIPALDGLRAVAVIAVVLYHMAPNLLPSGLLGVTLFFVLSGYLITGLLIREWRDTESINLPRFWMHRVRRLFPAIVLCLVTMCILTAFLAPDLLTKLRRDLVAALLWFTNWWYIFLDESYFEAAGAPSPVTHFWSLAIEEQFYLIWPPILLLLFTRGVKKKSIQHCVLGLAVLSVILMVVLYDPEADPTRVYYGTDTRAFSLLIGVWLAFVFPERRLRGKGRQGLSASQRNVVGWAGLIALGFIVVCMAVIDTYSLFLYYGGLLIVSVLTAVLIMALVNPETMIARVLSLKPLVWLGKISYGIYIWHYPLLLLMNDRNSTVDPAPWLYLLQFCVVVAVAAVSYYAVELPIRHGALGRIWHRVRGGFETWAEALYAHLIQIIVALALVIGAAVALIVVPDTKTQQYQPTEEEIEAIVPESAFENLSNAANLIQDAAVSRGQLLSQLGTCEALQAASNETLKQLVNTPGDSAEEKAKNTQFIMIGDSVSAAFSVSGYGGFSEMFPNAILDAEYSRRIRAGVEALTSYLEDGWNGPVVIFELATNGETSIESLQSMVDAVPEGKIIFVANTRSPNVDEDGNNAHIYTIAANNPNVEVLDWYANSAGRDEYFDGDGTHLTPTSGRNAYLNMMLSALETLYQ